MSNSFVGLDPDVTEVVLVGAGDESLDVTGSNIGGLGLALVEGEEVDEFSVSTSVIGDAEGASGDISEGGVTVVGYKETLPTELVAFVEVNSVEFPVSPEVLWPFLLCLLLLLLLLLLVLLPLPLLFPLLLSELNLVLLAGSIQVGSTRRPSCQYVPSSP